MPGKFEHFSLNIFQITHYWNVLASEEMKVYGMKGISVLYLLALYHSEDGMTATQLAHSCYRDKADVSRTLSSFKEKGLVQQVGEGSYRAILKLTEQGKNVAADLERRADFALNMAARDLSREDQQSISHNLTVIANRLKEMSEEGLLQE